MEETYDAYRTAINTLYGRPWIDTNGNVRYGWLYTDWTNYVNSSGSTAYLRRAYSINGTNWYGGSLSRTDGITDKNIIARVSNSIFDITYITNKQFKASDGQPSDNILGFRNAIVIE